MESELRMTAGGRKVKTEMRGQTVAAVSHLTKSRIDVSGLMIEHELLRVEQRPENVRERLFLDLRVFGILEKAQQLGEFRFARRAAKAPLVEISDDLFPLPA